MINPKSLDNLQTAADHRQLDTGIDAAASTKRSRRRDTKAAHRSDRGGDRSRAFTDRDGQQLHGNQGEGERRSDRGHTQAGTIRTHTGGIEQETPRGVKPVRRKSVRPTSSHSHTKKFKNRILRNGIASYTIFGGRNG